MATGNITVTSVDAFIPEIWSQEVKFAANAATIFAGIVNTSFDADAQKGDVVHVPSIASMTTGTKEPNTDVVFSNNVEETIDITLDQHKYFAFVVEDIARIQTSMNLMGRYTTKGGRDLAQIWDAAIASLIVDASITQNVGTLNTAGTAYGDITDALIREGIQLLDEANAPTQDRFLVVSPAQKNVILGIDKFVDASKRGAGTPILNGELGEIYGARVFVSNNLPDTASSASVSSASPLTVKRKNNMLFQMDAFVFATQLRPRVQTAYLLEKLGDGVVGDVIYGDGILDATWAVQIRTTSE